MTFYNPFPYILSIHLYDNYHQVQRGKMENLKLFYDLIFLTGTSGFHIINNTSLS
jgi:hypothetical protein